MATKPLPRCVVCDGVPSVALQLVPTLIDRRDGGNTRLTYKALTFCHPECVRQWADSTEWGPSDSPPSAMPDSQIPTDLGPDPGGRA